MKPGVFIRCSHKGDSRFKMFSEARMSWPGIFFQGPTQASLQIPPIGTAHRTRRCVQRLHNALYPPARILLKADTGPGNLSRWALSPAN